MQHDHILKKFNFGLAPPPPPPPPPPKSTTGALIQAFKLKSHLICFISIAALNDDFCIFYDTIWEKSTRKNLFSWNQRQLIHYHYIYAKKHATYLPVIHLQFWAYGSWDSLFPISMSPNCKFMSPEHNFQ